jgi:hypothetical protein
MDANIVIAPFDIKLCEELCFCKLIDDVRGQGQWIPIFYSPLIKPPVILNETQFSVLLLDKEDRSCKG